MKTLRLILLIITGIITVFYGVIINILGAVGFNMADYGQGGYGLLVAAPLLLAAYIMTIFKMSFIPAIVTVFGSAGYLYTIWYLDSLAAGWMPGWATDKIAQNHMPCVFVSVFLLILCFINFFLPEKIERRRLRKAEKLTAENRDLTDDEKITNS
jgi:hypothetical protein